MLNEYKTITLIDANSNLREEFEMHFCFYKYNDKMQYVCLNTVDSYEEFAMLRLHSGEKIDYLFLDIDLFGVPNLNILAKLKAKLYDTEIIIYTNQADTNIVIKALCLGASGYILKNTPVRNINDYLDAIENGGVAFSPTVLRTIIQTLNQTKLDVFKENTLTPRQFQILTMLAEGKNYKDIALILGLTKETVKKCSLTMCRRLKVKNKAEAVNLFHHQR